MKTDIYGSAVLLEEVGQIIDEGGSGVTISDHVGKWIRFSEDIERKITAASADGLLKLDFYNSMIENDPFCVYQISKLFLMKRVMAESLKWNKKEQS